MHRHTAEFAVSAAPAPADDEHACSDLREDQVQQRGALIVAEPCGLRIVQASPACERWLGVPPSRLPGTTLGELLPDAQRRELGDGLQRAPLDQGPVYLLTLAATATAPALDLCVHVRDGRLLAEFEPQTGLATAVAELVRYQQTLLQRAGGDDARQLCRQAVAEISARSGADRVAAYRLRTGGEQLLAEFARDGAPPSPDRQTLTAAARTLRARRSLLIAELGAGTVPLTPPLTPDSGRPADLSLCALVAAPADYRDGLLRLQAAAALTIPLRTNGELWGLILCLHATPLPLCYATRAACETVGAITSLQLGHAVPAGRARRASDRHAALNRRLNRRVQLLIDALPAQISYVDTRQRYRFVNAQYLKNFDRDRAQLLGHSVREVLGETAYRRAEPHILAALAGQPQQFDISLNLPGGAKHFDVSYVPDHDADGAVAGFYALVVDVTSHWHSEQALRSHRARLKRSNQELQQFAYIASHDLREPLRTTSSYLKLLVKRYADRLDGEAMEFIDIAVQGSRRMAELIDGLLDFSRIESNAREATPVALERVFAELVDDLQLALRESSAELSHDPLPVVMADPLQCRQLLQNLITNALKFRSQAPPRIHLGARRQNNGYWLLSVSDNGIGIKADFHQRIFRIFQRLHTRDSYPGTGLGLALCQRIVERHGGRLWVESETDAGATFWFTLPCAPDREKN